MMINNNHKFQQLGTSQSKSTSASGDIQSVGRRKLLSAAGAAIVLPSVAGLSAAAQPGPRVVVIGAGFGGATVAKYLRLWGNGIHITLVEPLDIHHACILSNGVVTGDYGLSRVTLSYRALEEKYGVNRVQGKAVDIDPGGNTVTVETDGTMVAIPYDKLVLAPGVDFIRPTGNYHASFTPHAWKAGRQTINLRNKLKRMPKGGTFVIRIPKAPYRCPPGPYERGCVVADYLNRRKAGSKVIVLDENPRIMAEAVTFGRAFETLYKDVIEYHVNVQVAEIDSDTGSLQTNIGNITGDVVNFIPDHRAGKILRTSGLIDDPTRRWVRVNPLTYGTIANQDIHVIGDSQATGQPKSGHMANAQAKVCADAIVRYFAGDAPNGQPVTSSACFSPITRDTAGWLTAVFQYDAGTEQMKVVPESLAEAKKVSKDNYEEMFSWADNLFADSFY